MSLESGGNKVDKIRGLDIDIGAPGLQPQTDYEQRSVSDYNQGFGK